MTIKKPKRAGLVALIFGVLLGLCLTVSFYTPTHAQDQAPAAEFRRGGSGDAGVRREGPKRMLAQFR